MDENGRSLMWQAWSMAGACVVVDLFMLVFINSAGADGRWVAVLVVITAATDLALAGPPKSAELVAVLRAAVVVLVPLLLRQPYLFEIPISPGQMVAGYRAGAWLRFPAALRALAALALAILGYALVRGGWWLDHLWAAGFIAVGIAFVPWMVGRSITSHLAHLSRLELLAERRAAAVSRAVAEERSAIARDLHDVISHHVSAISMHAGVARMELAGAAPAGPASAAHRSMSEVEDASRSAMADLRRMLDVLHGQDPSPDRRQPGLGDIDELLDRVRAAGPTVHLTVEGDVGRLPAALDLAAYRILQEALTNALRHGDGGQVTAWIGRADGRLALEVGNTLGAPPRRDPASPGRGLAGVRQRVALHGGEFRCGPSGDGRVWRLAVRLPVGDES
ncbi:sensor histidine kinase [Actinomadura rubteroloni]|uniref:sensor histidine kinase n=1 Tax=Actinomadura rubteroloni TaxID=1926885 RepID=UPI000CD81B29|nr:histidine kinase [Actinomadura rubteroloni]